MTRPSFALIVVAALATTPAFAETPQTIVVDQAWLRATPKGAQVAGGYVTITNKGTALDRLVGASLPIAPKGEVHSMSMTNGVMRMERLDKGLPIAPGATVTLSPSGGYHLMFMKPTAPLKEGETIKGALVFETAGTIAVDFAVAGMGARKAPGAASNAPGAKENAMPGMDMKGMGAMDMKH